jgi:chromosome segregation ATPase
MSIADAQVQAERLTKEKTGRTMQAKATPIREGVLLIEAHHELSDLEKLSERLASIFGVKTLQIYLHRDEGHYDEKRAWKPNLHAHMVFLWQDEQTGKSIKLNKQDMSEFQTVVAQSLGMQRGQSSDKTHLTALQFKNQEEQAKQQSLSKQTSQLAERYENLARVERTFEQKLEVKSKSIFGKVSIDQEQTNANYKEAIYSLLNERDKQSHELKELRQRPNISQSEYERQKRAYEQSQERLRNTVDSLRKHGYELRFVGDQVQILSHEELKQEAEEKRQRQEQQSQEEKKQPSQSRGMSM